GNYLKDLIGHQSYPYNNVNSVAFSPDDQTIVTVSSDTQVIVWDGMGNKKKELRDHWKPVGYVTFSPDGKYFVTCGLWEDSTAKLYDHDGNLIESLAGDMGAAKKEHGWQQGITFAAFSPDSQYLVTTSRDWTAKLWDTTGHHQKTLDHQGDVNQVVFSDNGNFVTCSDDGTARLWDPTGNLQQTINHGSAVKTVAFSPDGHYIATGGSDNKAKLWSLGGDLLATYKGHGADVNSVAFSPDGQSLVTASTDRSAKLWQVHPLQVATFSHNANVIAATFVPDGSKVLTAGNDLVVKLWDAKTHQLLKEYTGFGRDVYNNRRLYSLDVSPDGKQFITTGTDYIMRIWQLDSDTPVKEWDGGHRQQCAHDGWCGANHARYSPDGQYIVTGDFAGGVRLWDSQGNFLKDLPGHQAKITGLDISRDNQYIATVAQDKVARLWDLATTELVREFPGHTKALSAVRFSPDGHHLLTASSDQTAKLWHLETGELVLNLDGHGDNICAVSFSPTGDQIITASHDKTAKIWNRAGNLVNTLEGHGEPLNAADFSPDGKVIITTAGDNTARLWPQTEAIAAWLEEANICQLTATDLKKYGIDMTLIKLE
ncbi:MAG: hypothetical protein AAFY17_12390, partial [Cyanobacteria bacterium J06642_11]